MAQVKARPPSFVVRLRDALATELTAAGIAAQVGFERIPGTKLYRFQVVAKAFKSMWHTERQNLVWRVVNRALARDEDMRVAGIMTLTPDELVEVPSEVRLARRQRRTG